MDSTVYYILGGAAALLHAAALSFAARYFLHMLQLESYYLAQYKHHMADRLPALAALSALFSLGHFAGREWGLAVLAVYSLALAAVMNGAHRRSNVKKPLVYTARIKRQTAVLAMLAAGAGAAVLLCGRNTVWLCVSAALLSSLTALSAVIAKPVEWCVRQWYISDAKKILAARPDLKIIGITGSYGKTSTKFILSTILSEKYSVQTPPSSYNTTMGVVRVIRERLQQDDQVLICEMGARHKGDIAEICRFVRPHMGIITSIGPQHLETFGDIETVMNSKFELIEALPQDGMAFFPKGNEYTERMYERAKCRKFLVSAGQGGYLWAEEMSVTPKGSRFTLKTEAGESVLCETVLLGLHNIQNILLSAACAYAMGLTLRQIARGIAKLRPVEHRLQIVASQPMTVIDDAFNSSPNGAKAALEVLASFPADRIIVTPGFVELGAEQEKYQYELGREIAQRCEKAVLVGERRTEAIRKGFLESGGDASAVFTVETLEEASALLAKIGKAGDTVLFENDLPDNYSAKP